MVSFVWMDLEYHTGRKEKTMSKKISTYFPNYQLRTDLEGLVLGDNTIWFRHQDTYFLCRIPMLGMTKTQKCALRWFMWKVPVISISHERPTEPDRPKQFFTDPDELHRHYCPYAMAVARVKLMGEETPRKIKIYFCDVELHEENQFQHKHSRGKGVYIVAL